MTTRELYSKGTQVWMPSEETVWQLGRLVDAYVPGETTTLDVRLDTDGTVKTVKINEEKDLPPLRNPEIFRGRSDLTQLSYLNEPAVLHNLKVRFVEYRSIYTYCGIVLVAINPYNELPIYDQSTMETYRGCAMGELDPHIFAIAEEAYTKMEREDKDQAIIVSGESGAGKTVSAKFAMRYFAAVNGSTTETNVERRVLATNPIMEAIGNAKTTRNDNSSRFGKFIEIDFDKQFNIIGAKMRTYLLEKSRVVFQSIEERNYHIFYQLCAAAKERPRDFTEMKLGSPDSFRYTSHGQSPVINGVDDFEAFEETCQALDLLSFPQKEQHMMFCILAAILHLGDIKFQALDQDSCTVFPDDEHLTVFARLLGINASQMSIWLTKKKLVSAKEEMIKPMKLQEAEAGRDAFAKHIYARLFNWAVGHVNRKLAPDRNPHHFIGVLDIYGFETFEKNSFEQFCINYANEKLQQQFVIHVFKLEQEEYIREGIEWTMIDYFDNQPCIDLIEGNLGILDLLDEECRMPRGSDRTWNQKMLNAAVEKHKKAEKTWKYFNIPRFGNETFIIVHFADKVEYSCDGFLDKNRDTMNEEFVNLLRASDYPLVAQLFHDTAETLTAGKSPDKHDRKAASTPTKQSGSMGGATRGGIHKSHTQSVGSQFQDSLKALMETLNATTPHYVRCIKPNDDKAAFEFDPKRAIQQLRACGVLETIRISAAGYPSRWSYREFFVRYRVMCRSSEVSRTDVRKTVETIVMNLIKDTDKYKLGKTMIFFRAGQVAYMEKLRNERRMALGLLIQKSVRAWVHRKKYLKLRNMVISMQAAARGSLARKHFQHMRRTAAATRIQTSFRGFQQRKRFHVIQKAVVGLQALARGKAARHRHMAEVRHQKAIVIQKHVRGWLARKKHARILRQIVYLQSCWRRWKARKELKALKIQARDVDHIKSLNKGLENKIFELQHKLNEQNVELAHKRKLDEEVKDLRVKAATVRHLETEVVNRHAQVALLEQNISSYKLQLSQEQKKLEGLSSDVSVLRAQVISKENTIREMTTKHSDELTDLRKEKDVLQQASVSQSGMVSRELQERVEVLQKELADEKEGRQRTVDDLDRYKQRHANLENQMKLEGRQTKSHHQRTPSDVSSESDVSLATASTAFVPEIGDDGYSTQRSRRADDRRRGTSAGNPNWGFESPKLGDGMPDDVINEFQNGGVELSIDELQSLRNEVQHLRHQLDMRPELGEIVSERIRRLIEVNLSLRECLSQCQRALTGEVDPDQLTKLLYSMQGLLENSFSGEKELSSNIPNVMVEDVSGLDAASLNQLFLSLREALSIQASETEQFMDRNVLLSQKYTALMTENHHLKELLKRLSNSDAKNGVQTSQLMAEITQALSHNGILAQENQDLRKKLRKLEKKLTLNQGSGVNGMYGQNGLYSGEGDEMPLVHMKSTQQGLLEFQQTSDTTKRLADCLINVSPQIASSLVLPGLPAYLLFMAIRYTDHVNNEKAVKELLSTTKINIQNVLKKKSSGVEHFALWLLNGLRLVDLLKQYSGDSKILQKDNSPKQNEHCLKNFDLSAFRTHFDDLCLSIYRSLVTLMQRDIKDDAAKAVIEHESVLGLKEPGTLARRWKTKSPADCATSVQKKLEYYYRLITQDHALDPIVVRQIFRQLLFCLSANSVNFLMQSAKTCTFISGVQIRANISVLHEFVRSHSTTLPPEEMMQAMSAITECAHILQARKQKDEDIEGIVNMAKALSNAQIYKLLQNYTPTEDYDKVDPIFVQKMQARLLERPEAMAPGLMAPPSTSGATSSVSMNTDYVYPVVFPYSPSRVELDSIHIPAALGLDFVRKI